MIGDERLIGVEGGVEVRLVSQTVAIGVLETAERRRILFEADLVDEHHRRPSEDRQVADADVADLTEPLAAAVVV